MHWNFIKIIVNKLLIKQNTSHKKNLLKAQYIVDEYKRLLRIN